MRPQNTLRLATSSILAYSVFAIVTVLSMAAQNEPGNGFPDDWTHHHVIFSNPDTFQDAIKNGSVDRWIRIVNDPRYRIQQMKRAAAAAPPDGGGQIIIGGGLRTKNLLHSDWTVLLSGGGNQALTTGNFPAKYSFSPIGNPDCVNDFVVFQINAAGNSSNQANLVGTNNLYNTTCTGTVPTVLFAYFVGTGKIQTSPVLSLDGTKVAFVESVGASIFHVLKMDKSGNSGCPGSSPCNGTAYNLPKAPGTQNSAVDTKITMSGNVAVTLSSPFVDYANDIAYVGDDKGVLHKFTGVFNGTPAEVTTVPWPFIVNSGKILTAPTYDSISGHIFVGGAAGNLWCVTSAGAFCSTSNVPVGTAVNDAPLVDSTNQTVFAVANTGANEVQVQATTSLASLVTATMGKNSPQPIYDGAFDSAYLNNVSNGHLYECGADASGNQLLLRFSFNAAGTMASTPDSGSFALAIQPTTCAPLTEVLNTSQGNDYLFVGIFDHGFGTSTTLCKNTTCIASFVLPTSSPFTFPTAAFAETTTNLGNHGMSGFIIDNVSSATGASQLYFGNTQNQTGVQISQSALQ
jgi:hypothetical protein